MNDVLRWLVLAVLLLLWAAVEAWLERRDRQAERPPAGVLRFPDQLELRRRARGAVGRRG